MGLARGWKDGLGVKKKYWCVLALGGGKLREVMDRGCAAWFCSWFGFGVLLVVFVGWIVVDVGVWG